MKKALMYASVASMIDMFNMNNINILQKLGYQVEVACNFDDGRITSVERIEEFKYKLEKQGIKYYQIPIPRDIKKSGKIRESYRLTRSLVKNDYDLVHCHSPIGSVICRWAFRNDDCRMIYTAHGFHFFYGAPLINWLLFYPIERFMSRYTDTIITINEEDYGRAKAFDSEFVEYIPGVGVETKKYRNIKIDKTLKKEELNLPKDCFVILSVGELNSNKNHQVIIKALAEINKKDIYYIICGVGNQKSNLLELAQNNNTSENIKLLGYREDVAEIIKISDVFAFPSRREGLGLSAIEAMAGGLPLLTSNIHGINDYSIDGVSGFSYEPDDFEGFSKGILKLYGDKNLRSTFSNNNKKEACKFDVARVNECMKEIYIKNV